MKIWCLIPALALSLNTAFAEVQDIESVEDLQNSEMITVKEIKEMMKTIDPATTCMDEYLTRRKQLITSLALSPVKAAVSIGTMGLGGGAIGAGIVKIRDINDGWADLAYFAGGLVLGGIAGATVFATETTIRSVELVRQTRVLKTLAEGYRDGIPGAATEKVYTRFMKKNPESLLSPEEFQAKILELDKTGALCDGSMVKPPRIRLGNKLKHRLAKQKHIFKAMVSSQIE